MDFSLLNLSRVNVQIKNMHSNSINECFSKCKRYLRLSIKEYLLYKVFFNISNFVSIKPSIVVVGISKYFARELIYLRINSEQCQLINIYCLWYANSDIPSNLQTFHLQLLRLSAGSHFTLARKEVSRAGRTSMCECTSTSILC